MSNKASHLESVGVLPYGGQSARVVTIDQNEVVFVIHKNSYAPPGNTPSQIATEIAAGTYSGWTPVASGANVAFTNETPGANVGDNTVTPDANTGVQADIAVTTLGVTGVAEIINMAISGTVSGNGDINVTIRGATPVVIAISDMDTATQVATAIRAGTFPGWTTGGTGINVTFTADATGDQTGTNTYSLTTSTGVTAVFTVPTPGVTAVAEIITVTILTGALYGGNISIVLRGATAVVTAFSAFTGGNQAWLKIYPATDNVALSVEYSQGSQAEGTADLTVQPNSQGYTPDVSLVT